MKKVKVALTTGAAILSLAAIANAAPLQVNMVGASAQFDYFSKTLDNFLADKLACKNSTGGALADSDIKISGKMAYIHGYNCTTNMPAGYGGEIEMRVTGVASVEARAVAGQPPQYTEYFVQNDNVTPCSSNDQRTFYNGGTKSCQKAHIGAVDLDAKNILQISQGQLYGPMGGGAKSFNHSATHGLVMTGTTRISDNDTFAVPFGLFVNKAVKARQCISSTPKAGDVCTADADCGNSPVVAGDCNPTSTTIKNLSRLQVAMLFSGQTASWRDFGPAYDDLETVACLRHAGSGTAAAFDHTVMNAGGSGWGAVTATGESTSAPVIYFNDSTDTNLACANGNTGYNPTGSPKFTPAGGATIGAVTYADADKGVSATGDGQENLVKIKYNGQWPSSDNIRNGVYDWYTVAEYYVNPANTDQNAVAAQLYDYIKNGTIPSAKAAFWAQAKDMVFKRLGDLTYPTRVQ